MPLISWSWVNQKEDHLGGHHLILWALWKQFSPAGSWRKRQRDTCDLMCCHWLWTWREACDKDLRADPGSSEWPLDDSQQRDGDLSILQPQGNEFGQPSEWAWKWILPILAAFLNSAFWESKRRIQLSLAGLWSIEMCTNKWMLF